MGNNDDENKHFSSRDCMAMGRNLRNEVARQAHGEYQFSAHGRDPIAILEESNKGRVPHLIPIRYGRMPTSSFAFLRGSAALMAHDLSFTAASGIKAQVCGDCHLANFGRFATPERNLVFDLRQIHDMEFSLPLDAFQVATLIRYAEVCGWVLARAHAKGGDAAMISGYLGKSATFDDALADFGLLNADQNERDYLALVESAEAGRIEVLTEE